MKVARWLSQNLSLSIPLFLLLGLVAGFWLPSANLSVLITPLTLLMVYPMMVNIKPKQLLESGHGSVQFWALVINFLFIPFVAFILGRLFFSDKPELALGLLLTSLLPTSGMTISWTGFAKGNVPAAIKLTLVGLFLGSLLTPFYVHLLLGAQLPVKLMLVFQQILFFIAIPLFAGQLTRAVLLRRYGQENFQKHLAPNFPILSSIGVLGIVFVAMALKGPELIKSPSLVVYIIVPLVLLYAINYAVSTFVARKSLSRGNGIALVYGTVMRNLSIALALSMTAFGEAGAQAALLIALAYIIQVQSAAWYVKLTEHLFPAEPEQQ
ncbi:arsenic resistance protein [Thiopseudomonas acetoxidans]|uniref:Bile acid:sodium symporter n=1 Tax=Thiopseudomonas acetoxidans TaxID=3041622 RepID=A0ABT7SQ30_9GAMM|nr:bile acid:sodium symporter [Thiopseudomonas sp. CY1220]MDM7857609.1 bile acid:sodium symporter [Thiopseudomonas sp. CY1220]